MDKLILKTWLLNNKSRTYSVIVQNYYDRLSSLKTSLFCDWLAIELDVPRNIINQHSVSSALNRYKKQLNKIAKGVNKSNVGKEADSNDPFNTDLPSSISFR